MWTWNHQRTAGWGRRTGEGAEESQTGSLVGNFCMRVCWQQDMQVIMCALAQSLVHALSRTHSAFPSSCVKKDLLIISCPKSKSSTAEQASAGTQIRPKSLPSTPSTSPFRFYPPSPPPFISASPFKSFTISNSRKRNVIISFVGIF